MYKNYLKIAFRNLLRNKLFSGLNILGLVIGMVACLLILQYVQFEMSYDSFHKNAENIYRVTTDDYQNGRLAEAGAMSYLSTGEMLAQDFSEVEDFVIVKPVEQAVMAHEQKKFREKSVYYASPSFFKMFSFKLLQGEADKVLRDGNKITSRT